MISKYSFILIMVLAIAGMPQTGMAQRFVHGGGGGGFHPAPVSAPAQHNMAPPVRQAAPPRTAAPAPRMAAPAPRQEVHEQPRPMPTINGGARNFGNHDYNRQPPPPVVHENAHPNVGVHAHVDMRDHANVYHTGGYRGIHPYYYHPYRPYYWGPHWHPLGFFLTSLAADAIYFDFGGRRYWYDDGCYYVPANGGYSVVPPPIGAVVPSLPDGYETTMVGNDTFYYFGGAFYIATDQGYQVVEAPPGAVITQLPVGAVQQDVNGQELLVYNNVYYAPISQDGQDAYEVVTP
jgi:uncharacterized protein DUF6515